MNNFVFSFPTRVYFGKGCVREYLACLTRPYRKVMPAYGPGSIRRLEVKGNHMIQEVYEGEWT